MTSLSERDRAGDQEHDHQHGHRDVSGGWLRPAVFGAMDGLVTNISLIAGVGGSGQARHVVVITGVAGLVAGAFSMATGEYISVASQNESVHAEVDSERRELDRHPVAEAAELAAVYRSQGMTAQTAQAAAEQVSQNAVTALRIHVREELGVDPEELPSPYTAAGASFLCFAIGALLPLLPYLLGVGSAALPVALGIGALVAFVGGCLVSRVTSRGPIWSGTRQLLLGAVAAGVTFAVGRLLGASIG
ncbi:MAG: VIT1/CCC1 transporter family protein [Mycobacteriales bacterium]